MADFIYNSKTHESTTLIGEDLVRLMFEIEEYIILFINEKGIIKSWNKGAEFIFQYEAHEIV